MINRIASLGTAFPYNQIVNTYGTTSTARYTFAPGLSYNPASSTTVRNVAEIGVANGTANNLGTSYWYPNKLGGMVFINNVGGYNPGAGKTITTGYNTGNAFSAVIAWEFVSANLTYGADIIMGAYASSTHDWWVGVTGYSTTQPYWFSRNGVGYTSTLVPTAGRRYIAAVGNDYTGNTGYFGIWDSAGNSYTTTTTGVQLSTAGVVGIGKYGGYVDNYMPNIYVGDFWYTNAFVGSTYLLQVKNSIKPRYGISV